MLSPNFVAQHTRFADVDAMVQASGFKLETNDDLAAIPDAEMDAFIASVSDFATWQEMLEEGSKAWALRRLGL